MAVTVTTRLSSYTGSSIRLNDARTGMLEEEGSMIVSGRQSRVEDVLEHPLHYYSEEPVVV